MSGRPKEGYKTQAGEIVPGTTTIVGRFKDSGALIYWAWKCGKEGKDIRAEKDAAADAGSCCHEMIDCHLHNRTFRNADWDALAIGKAEHAFIAYLDWADQNLQKVIASEVSLVSERHRFGGTFDGILSKKGLFLLDYKTSNAIYADMLIQVAGGYSLLWKEHYPDKLLNGIQLLRVSKPKHPDDPVSFEHRQWSAEIFKLAEEQFLLYRRAYDLDKRMVDLV